MTGSHRSAQTHATVAAHGAPTLVAVRVFQGDYTGAAKAVEMLASCGVDTQRFHDLVAATAQNFTIREVSADKAYCGGYNF